MDDEARVGEALTKTIVCALKSIPSLDNNDHWLNPTEVFTPAHTDKMDENRFIGELVWILCKAMNVLRNQVYNKTLVIKKNNVYLTW